MAKRLTLRQRARRAARRLPWVKADRLEAMAVKKAAMEFEEMPGETIEQSMKREHALRKKKRQELKRRAKALRTRKNNKKN